MIPPAQRILRGTLQALWVGVIPGLLAGLVLKYLVPPPGPGVRGVIAALGRYYPVVFGAVCFLLFSIVAQHWSLRLRGESDAVEIPTSAGRRWRETLITGAAVATAAAAALWFRGKFVESYRVLSGSMLPTLEPEDRIAGRKLATAGKSARMPHRGDVVVFRSNAVPGLSSARATNVASLPDVLVKRVVGLPGDRITMNHGVPVINGWTVPTCRAGEYLYVLPDGEGGALRGQVFVEFLEDRAYLTVHVLGTPSFEGPYEVQPNEVFVLGDNRGNSVDSRGYNQGRGGGVPRDALDARVTWFLVGTHRSGDTDLTRLFKRVDGLERQLRVEGVNARELETAIEQCFAQRPGETRPPEAAQAARGAAKNPGAS